MSTISKKFGMGGISTPGSGIEYWYVTTAAYEQNRYYCGWVTLESGDPFDYVSHEMDAVRFADPEQAMKVAEVLNTEGAKVPALVSAHPTYRVFSAGTGKLYTHVAA